MTETLDLSMVDWSRAQFALTAMYHWLFVPLTLGLSVMIAIMETVYVRTGKPGWKRMTKYWMTLFGINFAIGVATGIILEFEFGTNWSNYSWFVGDIFGAPLAIEGIMAFFLESTFIAVMFFGWNKVGKKFHLASSWLTAIGANLSALWILVANAWMQYPAGMKFNPDTVRNEMMNFWDVLFSPVAINKFLHTVSSGYVTAAVFVLGISAWYLLRHREEKLAKQSITIAALFGLAASLLLAFTGDGSAYQVAQKQPMKLAAMEGLYQGRKGAGLTIAGILKPDKKPGDGKDPFIFKIDLPAMLSTLGYRNSGAYVPGVEDLVNGGYLPEYNSAPPEEKAGAFPVREKILRGQAAVGALKDYKTGMMKRDTAQFTDARTRLEKNMPYFGYAYLKSPENAVPNIHLTFYSFHLMIFLGFWFILLFLLAIFLQFYGKMERKRGFLWLAVWSIPLAYLASQAGWIVTEVGRQPWVIQDLMPAFAAVSAISASSVKVTFWLFAVLFTALLAAEVMIMIKQIKIGPKDGGENNV